MAVRIILAVAALTALPACAAHDAARRLAAVDAALVRIEARYAATRELAVLFAPWLPPAQAVRIALLADAAGHALAAARIATRLAARRIALAEAADAADAYAHAVGG